MKVVIGIDAAGAYVSTLNLIARLDFPQMTMTLLHVSNPTLAFTPMFPMEPTLMTDFSAAAENAGREALQEALLAACNLDLHAKTMLAFGSPADALVEQTMALHADLVAVTATHHGAWSNSFLGSISRALAINCPVSSLITKSPMELGSELSAIFATDHSPFADRCLEKLIALHPRGLKKVHVVSAYDVTLGEIDILNKGLPMLGGEVEKWVEETVVAGNARVEKRLAEAGYAVTSAAMRGHPMTVLRDAMHNAQADLLIVGAQGKGFLDRALLGSVSLHQVVSEPYPVLIIHP